MALSDKEIGAILVKQNYISEKELKSALKRCKKDDIHLLQALTDQGLITQPLYENALSEYYNLPFYDINQTPPKPELVGLLPEEVSRAYHAVVIHKDTRSITVATSEPGEPTLREAIRLNLGQEDVVLPKKKPSKALRKLLKEEAQKKAAEEKAKEEEKGTKGGKGTKEKKDEKKEEKEATESKDKSKHRSKILGLFGLGSGDLKRREYKGKINIVFVGESSIDTIIRHYRKPLVTRFQSIIDKQRKVAPEILEEILDDAIKMRASDIHFEPQEDIVLVRFRVDGVLHEAGRIPKEYYEGVVNRVKIEADMRTDEHFAAQDGAIRHKAGNISMDIRVSIVPIVDGEKIVMRLLAAYVRSLSLGELGFSPEHQEVLTEAAYKPFGMILTTGPTGSGKSTTLSALMKLRNQPDVNISTIEDPVEYKMLGINHIQVNPETDLTFASGLRSLVRQDPDVILVGEIRDGETADISINAALTGHLLFSTLHSNDSATAVPRLLDMGAEPFLLASTIDVIIAQRLVRRICNHCRYSYTIDASKAKKLFKGAHKFFKGSGKVTLFKGKGCTSCGQTGFKGRVGIYELLKVTPEIQNLIIARATSAEINDKARKQGMKLMFEDGFAKVMSGLTTIEELMRVAAPPDIFLSKHGKKKK